MTKSTKETKKTPKGKERIEEVTTPAGKFFRIYSGDKFIEMLTEQEYEQQKK